MHIKEVTGMDKAPTIYLSVSEDERATKVVALAQGRKDPKDKPVGGVQGPKMQNEKVN